MVGGVGRPISISPCFFPASAPTCQTYVPGAGSGAANSLGYGDTKVVTGSGACQNFVPWLWGTL